MARYTVFKNGSLDVIFSESYQDNGWSIANGVAIHDRINSGFLRNTVFRTIPNEEYTVRLNVIQVLNGSLKVIVGGVEAANITTPGNIEFQATAIDSTGLLFWSDGDVSFTDVVVILGQTEYRTILFSEDNNKFVGEVSYSADIMNKFLDDFYSFKEGGLWKHNVNETRNSFYGVVHPSEITFVFNPEAKTVKSLDSIRLVGNLPWEVTRVYVRPREGKPIGQLSRIKQGNFKRLQGQWFADFKRDLNDPRFPTELERLFKGALLQGEVAEITIRILTEEAVRLSSVDIVYDDSLYSY